MNLDAGVSGNWVCSSRQRFRVCCPSARRKVTCTCTRPRQDSGFFIGVRLDFEHILDGGEVIPSEDCRGHTFFYLLVLPQGLVQSLDEPLRGDQGPSIHVSCLQLGVFKSIPFHAASSDVLIDYEGQGWHT